MTNQTCCHITNSFFAVSQIMSCTSISYKTHYTWQMTFYLNLDPTANTKYHLHSHIGLILRYWQKLTTIVQLIRSKHSLMNLKIIYIMRSYGVFCQIGLHFTGRTLIERTMKEQHLYLNKNLSGKFKIVIFTLWLIGFVLVLAKCQCLWNYFAFSKGKH